LVELVSEKISVDRLLSQLEDHSTGAVVLFLGRVRDQAEGRKVTEMDYEAYPDMALKKMAEIENQVCERWPVRKIVMIHRTGRLQLGEISVAIAVASAHRKEAFEACHFAIDRLKETVPIWKKEYCKDAEHWVAGTVPKPVE
jgi:molybdopterin synthase catalytic subunit